MNERDSKVIVITGAGVGLGRALARRFVAEGERVALLGRTFAKVDALARELGAAALAVECDVASPDSVQRAFAEVKRRYEHVDVLINNAAIYEPFLISEASEAKILSMLATNLGGAILCSRAVLPLMRRGGHIINVSSESVDMLHMPQLLIYQCTKAGLERFTLGLERELEPLGVRASTVRAGAMLEPGKGWDVDPAAIMRFVGAANAAGINVIEMPKSSYVSATQLFRTLIDLPEDLHAATITLHARRTS